VNGQVKRACEEREPHDRNYGSIQADKIQPDSRNSALHCPQIRPSRDGVPATGE
jgi:hypothetical protein